MNFKKIIADIKCKLGLHELGKITYNYTDNNMLRKKAKCKNCGITKIWEEGRESKGRRR